MEDNRLEMSHELEEMRHQFNVMKERFDRQEIVTDRLMREAQKSRLNIYDWLTLYGPVIVLAIMLPLMYICCRYYGLPVWIAAVAYAIAAISIIRQYLERRKYRKVFRFEGDVLQIAGHIRNFRRRTCKMTVAGGVANVLFLAVGYSVWLPNIELTDDPLRWALVILLLLATISISVAVEIRSLRLLDRIVKDLEQ